MTRDPDPIELHVAADARDGGSGTASAPLNSLEAARIAVDLTRRTQPDRPVTVIFRAGRYPVNKSVCFGRENGSSHGGPLVLRAAEEGTAVFSGLHSVDLHDLQELNDRQLADRIADPDARSAVRTIDLSKLNAGKASGLARHGFHHPVPVAPVELFVDGRRQHRARWPADRTLKVNQVTVAGRKRGVRRPFRRGPRFSFSGDVPFSLKPSPEIWLDGTLGLPWAWTYNRVTAMDPAQRTMRLAEPEWEGVSANHSGFRFDNVLEALRHPGDYVLDARNSRLLLCTDEAMRSGDRPVALSLLDEPVLVLRDASHVRMEGLSFEGGRDGAIAIDGGNGCAVSRCRIRSFGRDGIAVNGRDHTIEDCDLSDIGASGIVLDGGDEETLEPSGNLVARTQVRNWGYWQEVYAPAIDLNGVGQTIRECRLHGGPHMAIQVKGNDHLIEANDIDDVTRCFEDMGAIYVNQGHEPLRQGLIIRHNRIGGFGRSQNYSFGVYVDRGTAGIRVEKNLFDGRGTHQPAETAAIKVNSGIDIHAERNVFLDCRRSLDFSLVFNVLPKSTVATLEEAWTAACNKAREAGLPHVERYRNLAGTNASELRFPTGNRFSQNLTINLSVSRYESDGVRVLHGQAASVVGSGNRVLDRFADAGDLSVIAGIVGDFAPELWEQWSELISDRSG